MTEHLILLTVSHNPFFPRTWKYAIPVLIALFTLVTVVHADQTTNNSLVFQSSITETQVADVRPSVTNEDLMPSPPLRITISGKITTPDGQPVSGAIIRSESESWPASAESGPDGLYRINNARGYRQNLSVEKDGYIPVSSTIVFAQNVNTADFTLEPATKPSPGFAGFICILAILITSTLLLRMGT